MKLSAYIKIEDATARFNLTPVGQGIYQANLVSFTGNPDMAPPPHILMVRNVREWSGSCEDQNLLSHLGNCIDRLSTTAPIFRGAGARKRPGSIQSSPDQ